MFWRKRRRPTGRHTLTIENKFDRALEIVIEILWLRYVLQPGSEMEIDAETEGYPFETIVYPGGMTVFAGIDCEPKVRINGIEVEPDYDTKIPE